MKKLILTTLSLAFLVACGKKEEQKAPSAMPYKVVEITKSNTTLLAEYPATLEGVTDIDIRAKVDGYIEKIYVQEGQEVKKGQLLFKLETQTANQEAAAAKAKSICPISKAINADITLTAKLVA